MINYFQRNDLKMIPFSYVQAVTLTSSGNNTVVLTTDTSSQFLLQAVFASSSLDADTDFMPNNFSVQLQDGGTNQLLSNALVPQRAGVGNAFFGVQESQPMVIAPQTPLVFTVQNLQAEANVVTFVLKGYKIFLS